ncbi:MAG: hypothetical protein LBP73_05935 [Clostridiales Family XIII bacterium]|nr:hypothetical protein [Clostridiales Family XIII bacterium]
MNIFVRVKAAGKRRDMLEKQPRNIPDAADTPEKLIECLVRENVRAYNAKTIDAPLFRYLSLQELEDGEHTGKIGFGDRKNERDADEEKAVQNALQCFADGIYRVLVNETEALPGMPFNLKEDDTVTFIRLVMLAGRLF